MWTGGRDAIDMFLCLLQHLVGLSPDPRGPLVALAGKMTSESIHIVGIAMGAHG